MGKVSHVDRCDRARLGRYIYILSYCTLCPVIDPPEDVVIPAIASDEGAGVIRSRMENVIDVMVSPCVGLFE